MSVDQAGKQRGVAQIDNLRACGMVHRRADCGDAIALNQNFAGCGDVAGFDVQYARGMEHDLGLGLRRKSSGGDEQQEGSVHKACVPAVRDASSTCSTSD